ncbi:MAG: hypothetical protein ACKOC5_10950 [Chloroflexota bacterium]
MDCITGTHRRYYAYLLRIFQPGSAHGAPWIISLQDPHTLEVLEFNGIAELSRYLCELTGAAQPAGESVPVPGNPNSE